MNFIPMMKAGVELFPGSQSRILPQCRGHEEARGQRTGAYPRVRGTRQCVRNLGRGEEVNFISEAAPL